MNAAGAPVSQMRREIAEIPEVVERLLAENQTQIRGAAHRFAVCSPSWLTIVARGSSDHAAVYARYLVETTLGLPVALAAASVTTAYHAPLHWRGGVLLAISQSGSSPDVVDVTQAARQGGALTIAVTNDAGSPLASVADVVIECRAGTEAAVPATKTYTASLVAIAALFAAVAQNPSLERALARLPEALAATLEATVDWLDARAAQSPVVEFAAADGALVVSRGFNLATAFEIALKLKETMGIFAEGYSAADLMHGPVALASLRVPALVVDPAGPVHPSIEAAVAELEHRGVTPWIVAGAGVDEARNVLSLPVDLPESLTPIPFVLPGYLLCDEAARRRGTDPDAGIGLQKVTRTR